MNDRDSNYYLGFLYLNGLGVKSNMTRAISHFERGVNDSRALNALGYIYFEAPDFLETDPVLLTKFGRVRRNHKKAKELF